MVELENTQKFILDATAGYRMMWFDKQQVNTIYVDNRPECNPDVVADFTHLVTFADNTFKLIVWDPPHEIRYPTDPNCSFIHDFGFLKPETWQSDLRRGFRELWRVLKPMGVLIFKWNTKSKKVKDILRLFPVKPLFGQVTKGSAGRRKHESKTYWFCFMKILEERSETTMSDIIKESKKGVKPHLLIVQQIIDKKKGGEKQN